MTRSTKNSLGQVFTIEGVVSSLILIVAFSYIITSMTFVSPQVEKFTLTKSDIIAHDTLNVFASEDHPRNHSSKLKMWLAEWNGYEPSSTENVSIMEPSIQMMRDNISLVLSSNMQYNVNLKYYNNSTHLLENKVLIYHGEPVFNVGTASKIVVLNRNDSTTKSGQWVDADMPYPMEVSIVVWTI